MSPALPGYDFVEARAEVRLVAAQTTLHLWIYFNR